MKLARGKITTSIEGENINTDDTKGGVHKVFTNPIKRRSLLKLFAASASSTIAGCAHVDWPYNSKYCENRISDPKLKLIRFSDRFFATLEIFGFDLCEIWPKPYLVRRENVTRARLTFEFPAQHFAETTIPIEGEIPSQITDDLLSGIDLRASGKSRLVFALPEDLTHLDLSLERLLDWDKFDLVLPNLTSPGAGTVDAGKRYFLGFNWGSNPILKFKTAVEMPWGLYLQPVGMYGSDFKWLHNKSPSMRYGRTELWVTQLKNPLATAQPIPFEVLDAKGIKWEGQDPKLGTQTNFSEESWYKKDYAEVVECSPTTNWDRLEVAASLSRRFEYNGDPDTGTNTDTLTYAGATTGVCQVEGRKIAVTTFGLSSLGGWLDLKAEWKPKPGCALKSWTHVTSLGRDHLVKYERAGFLYPFGIPAELVILSEREFIKDEEGHYVAPLLKQAFIRVPQPNELVLNHSETPFSSLSITTLRTPPLDIPESGNLIDYAMCDYFLPQVNGKGFEFEHSGIDHDGNFFESTLAMFFVSNKATSSNGLIFEPGGSVPPRISPAPSKPEHPTRCAIKKPGGGQPDLCRNIPTSGKGLRVVDEDWNLYQFRFTNYQNRQIALAPTVESGNTVQEVSWIEWVRGQTPKLNENNIADRPFQPRARTIKLSLKTLNQFSGQRKYMLATYRDLRTTEKCVLDPEPTLSDNEYFENIIRLDSTENTIGAYLHILPTTPISDDKLIYPFSGEGLSKSEKLREIYYGRSPTLPQQHPLNLDLFSDLNNEVSFGRQKSNDGLGGLCVPDSPIGLLTLSQGPLGDAVTDRKRWAEFFDTDTKFRIFENRIDYISYRLLNRGKNDNQLDHPFDPKTKPSDRRILSELYKDNVVALSAPALKLVKTATDLAADISGISDLASLFGVDAEILPGIRLSKVFEKSGIDFGTSPGAYAALPRDSKTANPLKWQYKISGLDEIRTFFGSQPGQISFDELTKWVAEGPGDAEPGEPIEFGVEASLNWSTGGIGSVDLGVVKFVPHSSRFELDAALSINFIEPKPKLSASAKLTEFDLLVLNSLNVEFSHVVFVLDQEGEKEFVPAISGVDFRGALSFINNLKSLLSDLEDEFGILIDITPQKVSVGQKIMIPPATGSTPAGTMYIGPATITNLNLNWGVAIPLIGRDVMSISFGLATREEPLTIFVPPWYGGKCHALIEATTNGIRLFEFSMEYGALILVEFTVARGEVSVMGGLFFQISKRSNSKTFAMSAYVKITGRLDILGIIEFSGLILLTLDYTSTTGGEEAGSKIAGQASITVSTKIGFVRVSYSFTARHEETRAGGNEKKDLGARALGLQKNDTTPEHGCICGSRGADDEQVYLFDNGQALDWSNFVSSYGYN